MAKDVGNERGRGGHGGVQPPRGESLNSNGVKVDDEPPLVFLCHSSGDKGRVRKLYERLTADGVRCWFDEEDLLPGQDWDLEIQRAMKASRFVLVCLSEASITKTGYVQKELRRALDLADEQPDGSVFLIPARLEECSIPERLRRMQYVDLFVNRGYKRLRKSLGISGVRKSREPPTQSRATAIAAEVEVPNLPKVLVLNEVGELGRQLYESMWERVCSWTGDLDQVIHIGSERGTLPVEMVRYWEGAKLIVLLPGRGGYERPNLSERNVMIADLIQARSNASATYFVVETGNSGEVNFGTARLFEYERLNVGRMPLPNPASREEWDHITKELLYPVFGYRWH